MLRMKAVILLEYVVFLLLTWSYSVLGAVEPPAHVTVEALNTHYVLVWDWSGERAGNQNVTFTAEWLAKYKLRRRHQDWESVCVNVSETRCDFTSAELNYLGMFVLHVRANVHTHTQTLHSAWVDRTFCPDSEAALGPPSLVEVSAQGRGLLEVKISDPVTHNNKSMKVHVPELYYRIQYWKLGTYSQRPPQVVDSVASLVTLSELEEWTDFCVRVQSRYNFYNKTSAFTSPQCIRTQGQTPYWQVALLFLLSLSGVFIAVMLFAGGFRYFFGKLKSICFPSNQLPIHIQEYLKDTSSDRPRLLSPESESELVIGRLDVCPEVVVVPATEETEEAWPEPEGVHHDRHGSGDSGVYSAEEASGGGVASQEEEELRRGEREWEKEERKRGEREREWEKKERKRGETEEDEGVRDVCV
ncbi:interferon alpha/beta receptor 1b-like [Alosa pseudoharengus]|uniref:interferon alpha/beta receptor 1b-like n=1 Tax=Alosa pseudoharengus TaxID=34774 RepID=UPI003F8AC1D8